MPWRLYKHNQHRVGELRNNPYQNMYWTPEFHDHEMPPNTTNQIFLSLMHFSLFSMWTWSETYWSQIWYQRNKLGFYIILWTWIYWSSSRDESDLVSLETALYCLSQLFQVLKRKHPNPRRIRNQAERLLTQNKNKDLNKKSCWAELG